VTDQIDFFRGIEYRELTDRSLETSHRPVDHRLGYAEPLSVDHLSAERIVVRL